MVKWDDFVPTEFEYDWEKDKLAVHGIKFNEVRECFFSNYQIRPNKYYQDRYQLIGKTFAGRRLKVIFQLKRGNVVRIITA